MNMIKQPDLPLNDPHEIILTPAEVGFDSSWCDTSHTTYGLKNKWTLRRYEDHGALVCRAPRITAILLAANYAACRDLVELESNLNIKDKRRWLRKLHKNFARACDALNLNQCAPQNFRHSAEVQILRARLGANMPRLFNDVFEYNGCTVREWTENEIRDAIGLPPIEVITPVEPSPLEAARARMIEFINAEFDKLIGGQ
jgi:hypothetical protein